MKRAALFCATMLASTACWADPAPVQVGNQRTLGRVTISLSSATPAVVRQRGNRVDVAVASGDDVASPENVPRNVLSFTGSRGSAYFTVVSGARARAKQEGKSLIIDVLDPASRTRDAAAGSRPNPGKPPPPLQLEAAAPLKLEAGPPAPQPTPSPAKAETPPAPTEAPVPSAIAASQEHPAAEPAQAEPPAPATAPQAVSRSFKVAAGADIGAAAFRRGSIGVVIFDASVAQADADEGGPNLSSVFEPIQRGTLVTVPLENEETLSLSRSAGTIEVSIAPTTGSAAAEAAVPGGIQFEIAKLGRVMAVSDPVSGQTVLIGTTRQIDGDHALVATARSAPGYTMLPTWLGVAVETTSDKVDLKASMTNFTLFVADKAAQNGTAVARQENQFSIPNAAPTVLVRQLNAQMASAASAAPRSRGPERVAAARTMLALGLSAESQAVLQLAATDDPVIARDPNATALAGIAAVLAGRSAEASGLDNPALSTSGDIALWRGLRDAAAGRPAPALAGSWPLLSAYPAAVRRQITPPVMEAAVVNGADIPAAELQGDALALARALKLVRDGAVDEAIVALTAIKDGRDERNSVRAAIELAELQLRSGRASPAEAAEQLDRQSARWRGGARELSLRLRVAELRSQGGQWRQALEGLRDTAAIFPDSKLEVAVAKADVFRSLLRTDAPAIAPLDLVLIAGEFADALPDNEDGDRLSGLLAEKLVALDLPLRAIPVLKTLIEKTASPAARFEYGLRLAQMEIEAGDPAAAEKRLAELDGSAVARPRDEQRLLTLARAKAAQGDNMGAATILLTLSGPEPDELRATYYAKAGDWQRSLDTLDGMVNATIPEAGDLDEKQQALIVREATAAVQAGNGEVLRKLARFERRITPPRSDIFRVLTASAVKGPEDLPRAARELAMSRALPDRLGAVKLR